MMDSERIFLAVGEFGRFQVLTVVFLTALGVIGHSDFFGFTIFYTIPDHNCVIPEKYLTNESMSYVEMSGFTIDDVFQVEAKNQDELKDENCEHYSSPHLPNVSFPEPSKVKCKEWNFHEGYPFGITFVTTFDMICQYNYRRAIGQSLTAVGFLLGAVLFGYISDKYGRVPTLSIAAFCKCLCNWVLVLAGQSKQIWLFYVGYCGVCACSHGFYLVLFVYIIEITGPRMRLLAPALRNLFEVVEDVYCLGFVYTFMNWSSYEVLMGTCGLLMLLSYQFCLESPLWLISKGLSTKAELILLKMAAFNKKTVPVEHLRSFISETLRQESQTPPNSQQSNTFDSQSKLSIYFYRSYIVNRYDETKLFVKSYPNICIKAALLCINWCVVAAAFYAIFFSVPNLGGDKYFNLFIISVIDYPVYLFCYVGMQRFGRKLTFIASMFSGGCCGLFIMLFRASQVHGMVTALSLAGAMCFSSCFTVIYMWTSEVFPTPIRNFSIGLCSLCGRVGMFTVPYFLLLGVTAEAIVCMLAFAAAILAGMLPETNNMPLPQTLREGEDIPLTLLPGGLRGLSRRLQNLISNSYTRETLSGDENAIATSSRFDTNNSVNGVNPTSWSSVSAVNSDTYCLPGFNGGNSDGNVRNENFQFMNHSDLGIGGLRSLSDDSPSVEMVVPSPSANRVLSRSASLVPAELSDSEVTDNHSAGHFEI